MSHLRTDLGDTLMGHLVLKTPWMGFKALQYIVEGIVLVESSRDVGKD